MIESSLYFIGLLLLVANATSKEVLVFGGNGLMGVPVVQHLLSNHYKITVSNRGNWYWDSDTLIKPFVHHIYWDRSQTMSQELKDYIKNTEIYAVVDFSAYNAFAVKGVLELFKEHRKSLAVYFYISSDSVYEVCKKTDPSIQSREIDAKRPEDPKLRKQLALFDAYGDGKLEAEDSIRASGVPFFALRLPDVIGPRDNTYRWIINQLWVQLPQGKYDKVPIDQLLENKPLSFVYSQDVGTVVKQVLQQPDNYLNEAVNFAWPTLFTLAQLYKDIARHLRVDSFEYKLVNNTAFNAIHDENFFGFQFPSVTQGPIDVSKARKLGLLDVITNWDEAINNTVTYYQNALKNKQLELYVKRAIHYLAVAVETKNEKELENIFLQKTGHFEL